MLTLVLLILPLIASLVLLATRGNASRSLALLFSLLQLGITLYVWNEFRNTLAIDLPTKFGFVKDWISRPNISFNIGLDGISMVMVILTNLLLPLIILSGFNRTIERPHIFYSLMMLMQSALIGVFVSFDGLLYYIFWELALIPIYFMAFNWGGVNRKAVTLKFFIYTLAGSLLMLFGFIFLYWSNPLHNFNWNDLVNNHTCGCNQTWLFWLFFAAFAIKIPIVPFHTWQPDTYKEAPTQGTMLLSGIMLKMGLYSLIRWLLPIIPSGVMQWNSLAIALCAAGIVYASIVAIMQQDLKKLFAYSSIAHVGLIAAGIFAINVQGLQGSMVQMLAHGINVVGLFFCADIIFNRTQSNHVEGIGGIRLVAPQFATYFMIVVLASVALPLTNGFVGEFMLLYGLYEYNHWLAVTGGLTIILGAVYMLRMYQKVMLGESVMENMRFPDLLWNEKVVLISIAVLIFFFGLYPKAILELSEPAVNFIIEKSLIK